jgi:dTDP-4-amino-4,6-dideoxygalactose transaminase
LKVEFFKHNLTQADIDSVVEVLHNPILTTGEWTARFENKFSQYIGCKYTVGVTSCTAALHLSLLAYGVGKGDEVITTPMTFIATANAILMAGAKPVFVDVETETGNINADLIENAITSKTKAIMPVHLYGQMCDMLRIRKIADKYHLFIIEDCAHAVESERDGIRPGQIGDMACFSGYATKSITAGESGWICTNAELVAEKLKKLRSHGMSTDANERYSKRYKHWDMEMLGMKYNMDNIQAALLINQVDRLEENWQRREDIAYQYERAFDSIVEFPRVTGRSGWHLFTIWVENRDEMLGKLQDAGIGVAVNYRAIHLLSYYKKIGYKKKYPVAERIGDRTLSLPLYPKLTEGEVEYVIKTVKSLL